MLLLKKIFLLQMEKRKRKTRENEEEQTPSRRPFENQISYLPPELEIITNAIRFGDYPRFVSLLPQYQVYQNLLKGLLIEYQRYDMLQYLLSIFPLDPDEGEVEYLFNYGHRQEVITFLLTHQLLPHHVLKEVFYTIGLMEDLELFNYLYCNGVDNPLYLQNTFDALFIDLPSRYDSPLYFDFLGLLLNINSTYLQQGKEGFINFDFQDYEVLGTFIKDYKPEILNILLQNHKAFGLSYEDALSIIKS